MKTIERSDLHAALASPRPPVLLEALPERYWHDGHLPGALCFPHDRAHALAPALLPDPHAAIVIYCASETCKNSHQAAQVLAGLGYADVAVYVGGKADWRDAGLPLERAPVDAERDGGASPPSP